MGDPLGPIANLAETLVIKDGNVFMVTLRDGRLPAGVEHPLGLWFQDCRFLSTHELRVCGELPRLLTSTDAAGIAAAHELTNPDLELTPGALLPAESMRIRIERTVEGRGALRQRISVRSHHRDAVALPLELRLGADFQPMLAIRGIVPRRERPPAETGPPTASRSSAATGSGAPPPSTRALRRGRSRTARSCSTSSSSRAAAPTWSWTSSSPRRSRTAPRRR